MQRVYLFSEESYKDIADLTKVVMDQVNCFLTGLEQMRVTYGYQHEVTLSHTLASAPCDECLNTVSSLLLVLTFTGVGHNKEILTKRLNLLDELYTCATSGRVPEWGTIL